MRTLASGLLALLGGLAILAATSRAATRYVSLNSANPVAPYNTWATAATTIQAAVDAALTGDEIVVTNGLYATGGRAVYGTMTNRVVINKAVRVSSVNGPLVTIIGGQGVGTTNGIRCVYVGANALLNGFTLTNGQTRTAGDWEKEQSGGGAWCEPSGVITNCILTGNSAYTHGGGAYNGTLKHCLVVSNSATHGGGAGSATINNSTLTGNTAWEGGGAYLCTLSNCVLSSNSATSNQLGGGGGAKYGTLNYCTLTGNSALAGFGGGADSATLNNCILTGNSAGRGGGVSYGTLNNCTVAGNSASSSGGGTAQASLNNCIVYYNSAPGAPNILGCLGDDCPATYSCSTPLPPGPGNITNAPLFVDIDAGNLRLQSNSPCINAGQNGYAPGATDMDRRPRIVSGAVDMGAYEFQGAFDQWLWQYGLATGGTADFADADGDGHNNWQEWIADTSPTNTASALRMIAVSNWPSGTVVSWFSVASRTYRLERAASLGAPVFEVVRSNLPGFDGATTFTDAGATPGAGPFFYRVRVE